MDEVDLSLDWHFIIIWWLFVTYVLLFHGLVPAIGWSFCFDN
jgi:hypothetical protein